MTYNTFVKLVWKIQHNGDMLLKRSDGTSCSSRLLAVLNLWRYGKHSRDQETQVGMAHNTILVWQKQVYKALLKLAPELISLPVTDEELNDVSGGFACFEKSRMINVVGAIDGTHIKISSKDQAYRNYKGWTSINCQVVVDHMFYIRHVCAGGPGCYSDLTMYVYHFFFDRKDINFIPHFTCYILNES